MNKLALKKYIATKNSITQEEANKIIDIFTNSIVSALSEGNEVQITGFGNFSFVKIEARECRNPRTGERLQINSYNQPKFKVGQRLKDAVNN